MIKLGAGAASCTALAHVHMERRLYDMAGHSCGTASRAGVLCVLRRMLTQLKKHGVSAASSE